MKHLSAILLLLLSVSTFAAEDIPKWARKGEILFIEYDYFDALEEFNRVHQKHPESAFVLRRIADCYRLMGVPEEAKEYYKQAVDMGSYDALDYYYCSEVHRSLGEYEAATYWMQQYQTQIPGDSRSKRVMSDPKYYADLEIDKHEYQVQGIGANEQRALISPTKYNDLLIVPIATGIDEGWYPHKRFLQNYDLYQTTVDDVFNLVSAEPLKGQVNSRFNEGPSCFDAEREVLYVTKFLAKKGEPALDEKGAVFSMILSYKMIEGVWMEVPVFEHNDDLTSCAYPAISPDGSKLFFSSNRKGGMGGMDIYYCDWLEEFNRWDTPRPLDMEVNTEGNEIYPSFAPDGTFCFASDGHPTLGGLDIFFADINMNPMVVTNPGMPVNSRDDDFGLVYMGGEYGYFTSNRDVTLGGDDLFFWEKMNEIIEAEIVLMDPSGNPLYPERVEVRNLTTDELAVKSAMRGHFQAEFNGQDTYEITWQQDGNPMVMHCKPEETPYGLKYVYDSPNRESFLADAELNAYRTGTYRKKKIPTKYWQDKNLTDHADYPAEEAEGEQYLMAQWNPLSPHCPAPGTRVFIKDLETGSVKAFNTKDASAEFKIAPGHMQAMTWKDADGVQQTRYVTDDEGHLRFLQPADNWNLALNEEPQMEENTDTEVTLVAALMASTEGGVVTAEDAGELLAYAEEGRDIRVAGSSTIVHAEDLYFGFDKSTVSEQEAFKVEEIAQQMISHPEMEMEIRAHTDSRGSSSYNKRLSQRRAESTKKKFASMGIDASRIKIVSLGEEEPVNDCFDGVDCNSTQHRLNRRAEIHLIIPGTIVPNN
ncbi:OmpA family protein [Sanyastnella coralliicola]|uniref:OmpA family protein n=1 Tax=Sanyastnella coralliicola TaxID=3069118 RepID=UPI0027B9A36A|nr:OmpA family protein [Longitalea sp. SCSIO 12813]